MPQQDIFKSKKTGNEYLQLLKFAVAEKRFSSRDLANYQVYSQFKIDKNNLKKVNFKKKEHYPQIRLLSDKLNNLCKKNFIYKITIKQDGKGKNQEYALNGKMIFDYFLKNHLFKELPFKISNRDKHIIAILFGKELETLLNDETYSLLKETHQSLEFKNIYELFTLIQNHILTQLISIGLDNTRKIIL